MVEHVHFYRLEYVSLDQDPSERDPDWCSKHFLDSNRYRWLKIYKDPFGCLADETSMLPIEYMIIEGCSPAGFFHLLCASPHLKYFQTSFCCGQARSSPLRANDVLTCLHLTLESGFPAATVINVFQYVPRLRKLHVWMSECDRDEYALVDPHWWENVLSKYLTELKRLCLQMSSRNWNPPHDPNWPVDLEEHTVHEQIEKSTYWRTHQWQLKYEKKLPTAQNNYNTAKFDVF